jgi:hypothetical protein
VTHAENVRRGDLGPSRKAITHCKHGHEFTPENTRIDKRGWRSCRTCARKKMLAAYYRRTGRAAQAEAIDKATAE